MIGNYSSTLMTIRSMDSASTAAMRPDSLPAVLCVDDDAAVLRSVHRVLAPRFRVTTALGPAEALDMARAASEPFAVVISDLRMPGLSGIGLLQCFRQLMPQTVRVLLSGNADLDDAVAAVNAGEIFRFLRKPYEPEALISIVTEACDHHDTLLAAARTTAGEPTAAVHVATSSAGMAGYVSTLSAMLSAVRPDAAECAARVARCVTELTTIVTLDCAEALRTAAALSQLGCAGLPAGVADRIYGGAVLSAADSATADSIPVMSADLLATAPGFDVVRVLLTAAAEVARDRLRGENLDRAVSGAADVALGARFLAAALRRDRDVRQGIRTPSSLLEPAGLDADTTHRIDAVLRRDDATARVRTVRMRDLREGMVLADDVPSSRGMLLAARGHVVTELLVSHIRDASDSALLASPVRVYTGQPATAPNYAA